MKKLIVLLAFCGLLMTGCNKQLIDTDRRFDKAIINVGGEYIEVDVKKWMDFDGEQLQITSTDGTVYLTSSFNCTLIKED